MGWGLSGGNGLLNEVPHSGVLCALHTQHQLRVLIHATREVQIGLYNISQPFLRTFVYLLKAWLSSSNMSPSPGGG